MPKRKVSAVCPAGFTSLSFFFLAFGLALEGEKKAASGLYGDVEAGEVMPKFFQVLQALHLRPIRVLTRLAFPFLL